MRQPTTLVRAAFMLAVLGWLAAMPSRVGAQAGLEPGHGRTAADQAAPMDKMAANLASLDERIAVLTADMQMFTGELKIQTMAALLEALVERQMLVDAEMRRMHEHMGGSMNDRMRHAAPPIDPAIDLEPETLCSPFI